MVGEKGPRTYHSHSCADPDIFLRVGWWVGCVPIENALVIQHFDFQISVDVSHFQENSMFPILSTFRTFRRSTALQQPDVILQRCIFYTISINPLPDNKF